MAEIVIAVGSSHSPILALDAPDWEARARNDRANKHLFDTNGDPVTYDELAERKGDRYASLAVPSRWADQDATAERCLDRLGDELLAANPDIIVIVGDDEHELFAPANMPAFSIYYGEAAIARKFPRDGDPRAADPEFAWMKDVAEMYGMDDYHHYPVARERALELIEHLIEAGFDVGAAAGVPEPAKLGFGHAFGFPVTRLMHRKPIPIVPVILNSYFPPNQPTASRCLDLGRALRASIERWPRDLRVAIVASGGLSHFVTNEPLDTSVLDALRSGDEKTLRAIPQRMLNDGTSEIRCWITMGGALEGLRCAWWEYVPVYRTPPGTGIGLAFARWS